MIRKTNSIIDTMGIILVFSFGFAIIAMFLLGLGVNSEYKEIFNWLLIISLESIVISAILFILTISALGSLENGYSAELKNVPIEFEKIYDELYNKYIKELEKTRKKLKILFILEKLGLVLGLIFGGYCISQIYDKSKNSNLLLISLIAVVILYITMFMANYKNRKSFANRYKEAVVKNLILILNPNLRYTPYDDRKNIEYQKYNDDSNLYEEPIYSLYAEDYIEGELKSNILINIADIVAHRPPPYSKFTNRIMLEGIFGYIEYDYIPDINLGILLNDSEKYKNLYRVKIENNEFEKYFNIYADSNVFVSYLERVQLYDRLVEIRKKYNIPFEIMIRKNKIYFNIRSFSVFEPDVMDETKGKLSLYTCYSFYKFIFEIVDVVIKSIEELKNY